MKTIGKYSFGIGDRFGHQGEAQLAAIIQAKDAGVEFTPVWNKSFRECSITKSEPIDTRKEADHAVQTLNWKSDYFVDADHINMTNVDSFIECCNFFTIDVADYIGKRASHNAIRNFVMQNEKYLGKLYIPQIAEPFNVDEEYLTTIAKKFLFSIDMASSIYQYIAKNKGEGNFITEISMDEVNEPQSSLELFFILSALSYYKIPAQTIAPKFTGRFNKGVDYVGDINDFAAGFEQNLLVIDFAVREFNLPQNLKLSIHSGSDKFSIYPIMGKLIKKYNKGIHIKTAGTTWLEEVIGLAMAGGKYLQLVKNIYYEALDRIEELSAPYASVIDINQSGLPAKQDVEKWSSEKFANTLRHIPTHSDYNINFRQLIHVAYKLAANYGTEYTNALKANKKLVGYQVQTNIYQRHIKRLFT